MRHKSGPPIVKDFQFPDENKEAEELMGILENKIDDIKREGILEYFEHTEFNIMTDKECFFLCDVNYEPIISISLNVFLEQLILAIAMDMVTFEEWENFSLPGEKILSFLKEKIQTEIKNAT